jgi:Fic family protein
MKLENFKAGVWRTQYRYKSFLPARVNQPWTWEDPTINLLLEKATQALGELNAFSLIVPDIDLFLQMHVAKEAQSSSRIEGTKTGLAEVLQPEEQIKPEKRDDWREVQNYVEAMNTAVRELESLPLSNRLLKQTHRILMRGVRGDHKLPGEYRTSQNWIGGSNLSDAAFVPPRHEEVPELMGDLERFWHNHEIEVPHLVRAAISHYQFETIHPFLDGNGRIGRLLITLYLVSNGILVKPSLYLSDFFERNRASYYDALTRVRASNDLIHWIRFFLSGVAETAAKGRDTFRDILALRTEVESEILALGKRAPNAKQALNVLYRTPVLAAGNLEREMEISKPTANALIRDLERVGILSKAAGSERYRVYVFKRYLNLFLS